LGIRILSDVLTASAKGMLMKSLNVNDLKGEALVYFKDEIKHRSKDPDVIAEKKNVKKVFIARSSLTFEANHFQFIRIINRRNQPRL
jgi:hypothetical protein